MKNSDLVTQITELRNLEAVTYTGGLYKPASGVIRGLLLVNTTASAIIGVVKATPESQTTSVSIPFSIPANDSFLFTGIAFSSIVENGTTITSVFAGW